MSEQDFLTVAEKWLKKQYPKYLISLVVFMFMGGISSYFGVRLALSNHETRIQQCEQVNKDQDSKIATVDTRIFNHIANHPGN